MTHFFFKSLTHKQKGFTYITISIFESKNSGFDSYIQYF